ncbi:MAG: hypothetical protein SFZ03_10595 [Candidatus Melainabacteria bacterium]|nr:hypothetical protein [Candidatus Melainabacteria bacterium]
MSSSLGMDYANSALRFSGAQLKLDPAASTKHLEISAKTATHLLPEDKIQLDYYGVEKEGGKPKSIVIEHTSPELKTLITKLVEDPNYSIDTAKADLKKILETNYEFKDKDDKAPSIRRENWLAKTLNWIPGLGNLLRNIPLINGLVLRSREDVFKSELDALADQLGDLKHEFTPGRADAPVWTLTRKKDSEAESSSSGEQKPATTTAETPSSTSSTEPATDAAPAPTA